VGLVIANMIGAGVFTTSGFAMGDLGSPVQIVLAWFIGGCLALCGALSYGSLSRLMPVSGGEYLFLSRVIHPLIGFVAGWVSLLAGFTGAIAYAAITFEAYLLPDAYRESVPGNVLASMVIIVAALAHGLRIRHGTLLQNIAVVIKLLLIAVFLLFVVFGPSPDSWAGVMAWQESTPGEFSVYTFALTLMWISFSYSGFNAAIYIASEVDDAAKILPRAMFYGTLFTMIIYLLLNSVFVFAPAPEAISYQQDVAAIAAGVLGGDTLAMIVRIIICIALFSSVSAMIMIGPRVYAKMADDGLMPKAIRFNGEVPSAAILMQAILAIIVVWISTLRELLSYLGFTLGLSAVITVASLFVIVRRQGVDTRQLPGYPWAPVIFILFTLLFACLAAVREPWQMAAAVITIVSGAGIYYLFRSSA
ncbi:MAG: amino acid permease, partial [Gammaproteobacteria bacterium]